jgi:hypothetical protein
MSTDSPDLGEGVLADGHEPADGLATVSVPTSIELVPVDSVAPVTVWVQSNDTGHLPTNEWVSLDGRTPSGEGWSADLQETSAGHWHVAMSCGGEPFDVEIVRRLECEDCGSDWKVKATFIDGFAQYLCVECREKWGRYLATFGGSR